jgi:Uma2 family endonuclease
MAVNKVQEEQGMALADFLRDFHEAPFELIHGQRKLWIPHVAGQTMMSHKIYDYLDSFGGVFLGATIIQEEPRDWVLSVFRPDVLFFSAERFKEYIANHFDWEEKPFVLVPELVIEVVSKNDSYSEINEKVGAYLETGVKEIWVIDPQAKNAFVHTADKIQKLSKTENIKSIVVSGFELKLGELFGEKA